MTFKKIIGKFHLCLGLSSGLVVFILSITGCIYAFQAEISDLTQPYRFVKHKDAAFLPPSQLQAIAEDALPEKHVHAVLYAGSENAAEVIFFDFEPTYYYYITYLDPYTGEVLKVKDMEADFFRFILDGHFYLWLPPEIGQPVVASFTLVFLVMMISGIILWWPRTKGAKKQRFSVKWNAKWRRKNYDLHSVLGFYATWIVIILAITGLVWGFEWFSESFYKATGGAKELEYREPLSDTDYIGNAAEIPALDRAWEKMKSLYPTAEIIEVHPPETSTSPIAANANPDADTYWQIDYRYFDQYTMEELSVDHIFGRITDANTADVIRRMNYDIHVGAILGLPGKILAFLASLIAASLPITGFCIWWGRRNKEKKKKTKPSPSKNKLSENNREKINDANTFSNDLASPVCYSDSAEIREEYKD